MVQLVEHPLERLKAKDLVKISNYLEFAKEFHQLEKLLLCVDVVHGIYIP